MKVVHFGAGNIGKGLIGFLLIESKHQVCFIDVDSQRVQRINRDNFYAVQLLDETKEIKKISPICALDGIKDTTQIIDEITNADLITTSVGANNLGKIAPIIIKSLQKRIAEHKENIDIIANENVIGASSLLREEMVKITSLEEMQAIDKAASFVNSAIDRQALLEHKNGEEIVIVEPYFEWIIDKKPIVNKNTLSIKGATYVEDMDFYITRKLYCVNAAHATIAYIGSLLGKKTIQEALKDEKIKAFTKKAMQELSAYLIQKYNVDATEMESYIEKTLKRFANDNLQDSVWRVGRSPIRKLGPNERLVGPLRKLHQLELPITYMSKIIAAAFAFENPEDEEAVEIQNYIHQKGINQAISHFTQLEDEDVIRHIISNYEEIKNKGHFIL